MVIVHTDNTVYSIDEDSPETSKKLQQFYHLKFEKLLKSNNIPYKLVDYENYDGDYFVGRFAHALPDKELHSKYFDKLYDHYGENMWPNKKAYYYYDDKVRQYELLERYGVQIPSIICNTLDELLSNVSVGTVVKSSYGAGGESCFYVWKKEHLYQIEEYISDCYNSENFFPCIVQEYLDYDWEYYIFATNDNIYGYKMKKKREYFSPSSFPYNNISDWSGNIHRSIDGKSYSPECSRLNEKELESYIDVVLNIKNELGTPNLKFDILDNKVLELSYLYGEVMPYSKTIDPPTRGTHPNLYLTYDIKSGSIGYKEQGDTFYYWNFVQINSILKHLGIIENDILGSNLY